MKDQVFFGGVPTDPEVKALRTAFPEGDMKPGDSIDYEHVERIIGVGQKSSRFRTVTNRWRSIVERETGKIVIQAKRGAFVVSDNTDKIDLGNSKLGSAVKFARRAYVLTGRVDLASATEEEKERLLALQRRSAAIISTAQIRSNAELPTLER